MCGVIGIASRIPVVERAWLAAGRDYMHHRGPDDAGEWWSEDGRVGLGHRRLSIIDLSPAGHQPMQDDRGDLCIVLNGEIYNFIDLRRELLGKGYSFRSHTDTEVLLAAYREWGTDCLSRLNGMYGFALYDKRTQKLFMARDRAGEKPLFYMMSGGSLRFASELKGLMADPTLVRHIDPKSLDCYLSMGFVPGNRCILKGVNKLPPAHALVFDLGRGDLHTWCYWQAPYPSTFVTPGSQADATELMKELEALLEDSVRRQLVADVPVGVLLSGGVDSSLVTAMAVRVAGRVKTFTIRFPQYCQYDETEHARLIARYFGTEHIELDAAETTVDLLPRMARQFDEPIVDSSMIPTYVVSQLVRQHCTVALGGDGGDELFGGYGHYDRILWMWENLGWIPRYFRQSVSKLAENLLPVGFKGRNWLQGLGADFLEGLPLIASYFERGVRSQLFTDKCLCALVAEEIWEGRIPRSADILQRATRMDFENYLPEDILVKVDRSSMLNSLEIRAPLLDYRIVEFAFGRIPSYLKATKKSRKVILKKLAAHLLPQEFDLHRKQGFSIPLGSWLQNGPWLAFFQDVLLDSDDAMFNSEMVGKLLKGQTNGRANSERLFALVLFELWRREYHISI